VKELCWFLSWAAQTIEAGTSSFYKSVRQQRIASRFILLTSLPSFKHAFNSNIMLNQAQFSYSNRRFRYVKPHIPTSFRQSNLFFSRKRRALDGSLMPSGLAGRQFRAVVIQPTSLASPGEPGCVAWACGLISFQPNLLANNTGIRWDRRIAKRSETCCHGQSSV
jgi:hypothetical protein